MLVIIIAMKASDKHVRSCRHVAVFMLMLLNSLHYSSSQNETNLEDAHNKSCEANATDGACEMVTTEGSIILETDGSNSTETTDFENSTWPVQNATKLYSSTEETEESTTQHPETTTEQMSLPVETVEARPVSNEVCTCDLIMNSCDINCCCDLDCTEKDRLAFSGCHTRAQYDFDPQHCYQTHFIYHNNTELKLVRNRNGLFCIVRDNLPTRFIYQNRMPITTLHEFRKIHRRQKIFPWSSQIIRPPVFDPSVQMKVGEIIWIAKNKSLIPFSLPVSVTSYLCQSSKLMLYLHDWSSTCTQVMSAGDIESCENHQALSASTYYSGISVLPAPQLVTEYHIDILKEGCPANVCIPITLFLCSENPYLSNCTEVSDIQNPVFHSKLGVCENVVNRLSYKIHHNGTDGITKFSIFVWLASVNTAKELLQTFSVSFHWTKDNDTVFHRSGNPGYVVGKPVMSGKKVTQIIDEEMDKEVIEVSSDPSDWLSVATAMKNGKCDLDLASGNTFRHSVTYGEDRWSSCMISVNTRNFSSPSSCAAMHKTIIKLLAGEMIENATAPKKFNLYIATFGDSKVENTGDWAQVILESIPSYVVSSSLQRNDWSLICKNLVTSIHIEIMFAHVGSLAIPQAKILGTAFRFGPPQDIVFECTSLRCVHDREEQQIRIVSTVSFIDVTKPPVTEFAEPPVYEIKLPRDFFYPFFSDAPFSSPTFLVFVPTIVTFILTQNLEFPFIA